VEFDVLRVGELAKFVLTDKEVTDFHHHIDEMMKMIEVLPEIPDGENTNFKTKKLSELRDDIPRKSLDVSEVLENAPTTKAGFFIV
jgi:aspartyl/glutamyl-tRNA(Asn/Gln) amidotransferase C subunit